MREAARDIQQGLGEWRLWGALAWYDIKGRYRRSIIGPFWLTLSVAAFIAFISVLFSQILGTDPKIYVPHLTTGYIIWLLLSSAMTDACGSFTDSRAIILQRNLPFLVYIARMVCRNFYIFLHNILVFIPVMFIFSLYPNAAIVYLLPGLVLIIVNILWISLLLAIVSTRFRDIPPLIVSLVQLAFFATPIIWMPDRMVHYTAFVDANLFYHLIELVRAPLLGHAPSDLTWVICMVTAVVGWSGTFLLFGKYRQRIVYWL